MSNVVTVKIPLRSQFLVKVLNLPQLHSTFETLLVIWDPFQHLKAKWLWRNDCDDFPDTVIIGLRIEMSVVILNALYKYRLLSLLLFETLLADSAGHSAAKSAKRVSKTRWGLNFRHVIFVRLKSSTRNYVTFLGGICVEQCGADLHDM